MIIFLLNFVEYQDGGGRCHSCLDGSQVKSEMKWMLKKIIIFMMMSHHRMIIYAHHHDDQVREGLRRGLLSWCKKPVCRKEGGLSGQVSRNMKTIVMMMMMIMVYVPGKEVNGQFQQDPTRNKQCAASQLCRHQRVHDAHVQTAPGR